MVKACASEIVAVAVAAAVAGVAAAGAIELPSTASLPPVTCNCTASPAMAPLPQVCCTVTRPRTSKEPVAVWSTVPSLPSCAVTDAVQVPISTRFGTVVAYSKVRLPPVVSTRSEEHTSELQSLMRISYAVFCLKKNKHECDHLSK